MASDQITTEITCPACQASVTILMAVRYQRRDNMYMVVDPSAVRQHVANHEAADAHDEG